MTTAELPSALNWVRWLEKKRANISDAEDRAKVDIFIEHLLAEHALDVDRTMATMAPDGISYKWGARLGPTWESTRAKTSEERRSYYEVGVRTTPRSLQQFEMATERFFVGEDGIVADGIVRRVVQGRDLAATGDAIPEGGDADDLFLVERRLALFMSYRDGLIVGEDQYWDGDAVITRIES